MSVVPISGRTWSDYPANLALLVRYLGVKGVTVNWTDDDYAYLLEKPWKWQAEWDDLQTQLAGIGVEDAA